ncbi:unnamed protein product, partial [Ceratitis capitata]
NARRLNPHCARHRLPDSAENNDLPGTIFVYRTVFRSWLKQPSTDVLGPKYNLVWMLSGSTQKQ